MASTSDTQNLDDTMPSTPPRKHITRLPTELLSIIAKYLCPPLFHTEKGAISHHAPIDDGSWKRDISAFRLSCRRFAQVGTCVLPFRVSVSLEEQSLARFEKLLLDDTIAARVREVVVDLQIYSTEDPIWGNFRIRRAQWLTRCERIFNAGRRQVYTPPCLASNQDMIDMYNMYYKRRNAQELLIYSGQFTNRFAAAMARMRNAQSLHLQAPGNSFGMPTPATYWGYSTTKNDRAKLAKILSAPAAQESSTAVHLFQDILCAIGRRARIKPLRTLSIFHVDSGPLAGISLLNPSQSADLSRAVENLETFIFHHRGPHDGERFRATPVSVEQLETFLCCSLVSPKLQHICIDTAIVPLDHMPDVGTILDGVRRPKLSILCLGNIQCTSQALRAVMEAARGTVCVRLASMTLTGGLWEEVVDLLRGRVHGIFQLRFLRGAELDRMGMGFVQDSMAESHVRGNVGENPFRGHRLALEKRRLRNGG